MSNDSSKGTMNQPFSKSQDLINWKNLYSVIKDALDNGHYDAVLEHSSPGVDELQARLVQLIKLRAVAWARKGKYSEEIKEGSMIIQCAPHDITGYLCVGGRYVNQGFQSKAIEIFDKGLRNVPQDDPCYQILCDAKNYALKRRSQRIDILANVPLDVMCLIVDQISQDTLGSCVNVCRLWRQRLLEYPSCWRKVHVEKFVEISENGYYHTAQICQMLPLVCQYIRELSMPHSPQLRDHLRLIETRKFVNLQTLQIRDAPHGRHTYEDYCDLLQQCLENIADSLTSLDIVYFGDDTVYLSKILYTCRNLTTLSFRSMSCAPFIGLSLPRKTLLRKVVMQGPIKGSDLGDLLRCSPEIRYLAFDTAGPYYSNDLYAAVVEHCSNSIRTLSIGFSIFELNNWVIHVDTEDSIMGLTSLSAKEPLNSSTLAPLITKHSDTLRCLHIQFSFLTARQWGTLSTLALDALTRIHLDNTPKDVTNDLPDLLRLCSNLETISLSHISNSIPDQAFTAAVQLKQLTSLQLKSALFSEQSILQLLHGVQKERDDGRPGIRELKIQRCEKVTSAVLVTCAAIETLVSLDISTFTEFDGDDEEIFATKLKHLPKLQKLCLTNMDLLESNLLCIAESKTLKEVELYNIYQLTSVQIQGAFPSHVSLKFREYEA